MIYAKQVDGAFDLTHSPPPNRTLQQAARDHAKLGTKHLDSLQVLTTTNAANFRQLTEDLEQHMEAVSAARAARTEGQQDEELLASVAATTATLLAGAKGSLASLAVQRNLIAGALDYQKAQTADGVLQTQLDKFVKAYGGANAEEDVMLSEQIARAEAATRAQVEGTINEAHSGSITKAAQEITTGLQNERSQLVSLVEFQEQAAESLVSKVSNKQLNKHPPHKPRTRMHRTRRGAKKPEALDLGVRAWSRIEIANRPDDRVDTRASQLHCM